MGLRSFYLAVNCHFFFAGLRPAPRWGPRRPPDPRVRPCSASRSPKRQVRLSAEVTSGRPTSKKTAIHAQRECVQVRTCTRLQTPEYHPRPPAPPVAPSLFSVVISLAYHKSSVILLRSGKPA